ncbi:MAG: sterol desaturase family protein [Pseudomonadales bacterium]|jgi:sterol desaturase/sphingolipid hydroxylase (fatty acid hydroxylase superfamily)|nr:sterol desaturase family protein [Pseudomonadales bacterium]
MMDFEMPFAPNQLLDVFLLVFALFLGHFLIIACAAWIGVWQLGREAFAAHRVQQSPLRDPRPRRELAFSVLSILIFSLLLTGLWVFERFGLTAIYWDVAEHGTAWFVSQIAVLALVHDSYYYWAHRWMHHPKVFRHVHKLHHGFHNPTPFASYAFHPFEAIVEVAWIAPLAFLMPIHPLALAGYVVFLTVLNVVSHLGHEFYPAWVARWFITSTHHNMHHTRGRGHFMLYFNIWDRLMGTNATDYEAAVREINERVAAGGSRAGKACCADAGPSRDEKTEVPALSC